MKILISADMEGVCGVSSWVQVMPPELGESPSSTVEYERARLRMTREVNAAVEGAIAGGVSEVIVNDSHDGMRNLIAEELHPEVRFISGSDKELGMMQGLQEQVQAAFFTGYHAKAGTPAAPLAHTWTGFLQDVRLNDRSTGEYGLNASLAGYFGVPVIFACGDDKAIAQIHEFVGPELIGVAVKEGYSSFSAIHLHPSKAQELIRQGAEEAIKRLIAGMGPKAWVLPADCQVELEFDHQTRADKCLYIADVKRTGERSVGFTASDALMMNKMFRALVRAASGPMSP